jgi:hypothetical protein
MQRSRSQVVFRHLPGAVYHHDDGPIIRTTYVDGARLGPVINKAVLLEEIDRRLADWPEENLAGIVRPSRLSERDFVVIEPDTVYYEVWPLLLQCDGRCGRTRRYFRPGELANDADASNRILCRHCGGRMRQLRYYACHQCGRAEPMFTPKCDACNSYENVVLEDTGSFETSYWRCLTHGYLRGTRFTPCDCGRFLPDGTSPPAFMRAFTTRDARTYYPHTVTFLNPKSVVYDRFQVHPARARVALASYVGEVLSLQRGMEQVDGGTQGSRYTPEQWDQACRTIYAGLPEEDLQIIRDRRGPVVTGVFAVPEPDLEQRQLGESRPVLERAAVHDQDLVPRRTLADARQEAESRGATLDVDRLASAERYARRMGIAEVAVTMAFPVALAAYGYTRVRRDAEQAILQGFDRRRYHNQYPIFAIPTDTEALLVTLSAADVLAWLRDEHSYPGPSPSDETEARLHVFSLFASHAPETEPIRTLLHSASHALLGSLAEGRSGFGEASLAEWLSPATLTFGIYVATFHSHTLGALWTVLHHSCQEWLAGAIDGVWTCDNDPLCHQREPRACERCLYLTFGCPDFNRDLSRTAPMTFWRGTARRADALLPPPDRVPSA